MFEPETDNQPSIEHVRLSAIYEIQNRFQRSDTSVAVDLSRLVAVSETRFGDRHRDHRFLLWMDGGEQDGIVVPFQNYDRAGEQRTLLINAWKAYRDQRP